MVERELGVNPHDFSRWVCLHEETHRVQFTSVPWLRGYVQGMMTEFLLASDLDAGAIVERLRSAAGAVAGAVRGGEGESLMEAMQTPAQRELLDKLTAVMTLVEGHGDYVMDAVARGWCRRSRRSGRSSRSGAARRAGWSRSCAASSAST